VAGEPALSSAPTGAALVSQELAYEEGCTNVRTLLVAEWHTHMIVSCVPNRLGPPQLAGRTLLPATHMGHGWLCSSVLPTCGPALLGGLGMGLAACGTATPACLLLPCCITNHQWWRHGPAPAGAWAPCSGRTQPSEAPAPCSVACPREEPPTAGGGPSSSGERIARPWLAAVRNDHCFENCPEAIVGEKIIISPHQ